MHLARQPKYALTNKKTKAYFKFILIKLETFHCKMKFAADKHIDLHINVQFTSLYIVIYIMFNVAGASGSS